jgi:hypothetical protein
MTKDELWMSLRSVFLIYKIDRIPYWKLDVQCSMFILSLTFDKIQQPKVSFSIKLAVFFSRSGCEQSEFPDDFLPGLTNNRQVTPAAQTDLRAGRFIGQRPRLYETTTVRTSNGLNELTSYFATADQNR